MRKLYTFVMISVAVFYFATCKQYTDSIEDFLSYWASEAAITEAEILSEQYEDADGFPSVPSEHAVKIRLTVRNPQRYRFLLPTDSANPEITGKIIIFDEGVVSSQSVQNAGNTPTTTIDYTFTQPNAAYNHIILEYKADFLQTYEWGERDISPTITLYSQEGRPFSSPFRFKIKANTRPPSIKNVILAKTTGADPYYVLCMYVPDMDKRIKNNTALLHKDITSIQINDTVYPLSAADTHFNKPDNTAFIDRTAVEKLNIPNAEDIPEGNWNLFYKTKVQIAERAAVQTYAIQLIDTKGVKSAVYTASTNPNKPEPVHILLTEPAGLSVDVNSANTAYTPHIITVPADIQTAALAISCPTAASSVHYTLTPLSEGNAVTGKGNPVSVSLALNGKETQDYRLEVFAEAAGFALSDIRTVHYSIRQQTSDTAVLENIQIKQGTALLPFRTPDNSSNIAFDKSITEYTVFVPKSPSSTTDVTVEYLVPADTLVTDEADTPFTSGTSVTFVGGQTQKDIKLKVKKGTAEKIYTIHLKLTVDEQDISGNPAPYVPVPYKFIVHPENGVISGSSRILTITFAKKNGEPLTAAEAAKINLKLRAVLYQNNTSLESLGQGRGWQESTGRQVLTITVPNALTAGMYRLYLQASVNGAVYDGWKELTVN